MIRAALVLALTLMADLASAQTNGIDLIRPDAPELASLGTYGIGVRTLVVVDSGRPDVVAALAPEFDTLAGNPMPMYDRPLTVEVWYPADRTPGLAPRTNYTATTRYPGVEATLTGRAVRDAITSKQGPFPLVILSHGSPGNRYMMSHLGENLASKGYVVASIDHTDNTFDNHRGFRGTLYNRAPDQRAVLDAVARFASDADHFLHGLADANHTAIIGHSMGGYGALNNLGAGYSQTAVNARPAPISDLLGDLLASNPDYRDSLDPRIKAGIPIAPWGMRQGFWDARGLEGLTVPTLFVAGDADPVVGYEGGVRALYDGAINSERYLLVFKNAGHNPGARIPEPVELWDAVDAEGSSYYRPDPVWDHVRMNNILQHFVTAFLDLHLKGVDDMRRYLDVPEDGAAAGPDGWPGFTRRGAVGLMMYGN
jgi:predicted dienelactone hydrolase